MIFLKNQRSFEGIFFEKSVRLYKSQHNMPFNGYYSQLNAITYLRETTDEVHCKRLLSVNKDDLQAHYWNIHQTYYQNLWLAYLAWNYQIKIDQAIKIIYQPNTFTVGSLRKKPVFSDSFLYIHQKYLPELEPLFFNSVEQGLLNVFKGKSDLLSTITMIDVISSLMHFPLDGSKRVGDGFIVNIAEKLGFNLSLSNSGYRNFSSNLVTEKTEKMMLFKEEFLITICDKLDFNLEEIRDLVNENRLVQFLKEEYQNLDLFYEKQKDEILIFLNALCSPEKLEDIRLQYSSFLEIENIWKASIDHEYVIIQDLKLALICDEILWKIMNLQGPRYFWLNDWIEKLKKEYPDEKILNILQRVYDKQNCCN